MSPIKKVHTSGTSLGFHTTCGSFQLGMIGGCGGLDQSKDRGGYRRSRNVNFRFLTVVVSGSVRIFSVETVESNEIWIFQSMYNVFARFQRTLALIARNSTLGTGIYQLKHMHSHLNQPHLRYNTVFKFETHSHVTTLCECTMVTMHAAWAHSFYYPAFCRISGHGIPRIVGFQLN